MNRRRLSALAAMRAAYADRHYPRLKAAILTALQEQVHDVAREARDGRRKFLQPLLRFWRDDLARILRQHIRAMASHGWALAGEELGTQPVARHKIERGGGDLRGKAVNVPGWDDFVLRANWKSVDRWVDTTSESASNTSAERLTRIFTHAADYMDPDTKRGLTPMEIAKRILADGLTQCEARAAMLAHTGAIWSYNEGAVQRYQADGVPVVEWLTSEDDLRCEACANMNGTRIETGSAFVGAGETFSGIKIPGGTRGFDVRHPPLHPNCRCTLIPIVDAGQSDELPEPPPEKVPSPHGGRESPVHAGTVEF